MIMVDDDFFIHLDCHGLFSCLFIVGKFYLLWVFILFACLVTCYADVKVNPCLQAGEPVSCRFF